jgi:hypothetical protein
MIVNAPLIHRAPLAHRLALDVDGALNLRVAFTAQAAGLTTALALRGTTPVLLVLIAYQPDP